MEVDFAHGALDRDQISCPEYGGFLIREILIREVPLYSVLKEITKLYYILPY